MNAQNDQGLFSRAMLAVVAAQFLSAMADNALLFGVLALLRIDDWSVPGTLGLVTACYAAAAVANLLIPKLPPAHALNHFSLIAMLRDFVSAVRTMVRIKDTRFSMIGTSLFWGTGGTMRFLLVAWVPVALGITTNRMPAYLNAMVAVGIVIGAGLASQFVTLDKADRALPAGVLIGAAVCLLAVTTHLSTAFVVMNRCP